MSGCQYEYKLHCILIFCQLLVYMLVRILYLQMVLWVLWDSGLQINEYSSETSNGKLISFKNAIINCSPICLQFITLKFMNR